MAPLGGISARSMFGGHGIYKDGLMFGLVANDVLYLKTDATNRAEFVQCGLAPFTYEIKGKQTAMSYFEAPADALESPAVMIEWARRGFSAALRASAKRVPKHSSRKRP